ncbi:MAG: hypothetical protein ACJ8E6_06695 [Sphingomicrobium sp.]
MIRIAVLLLAALPVPAIAQTLTYDSGKALALTQGQWTYAATPTGSESRFGNALSLRCDRPTRTVTISRPSQQPAALSLATDSLSKALPPSGRLSAFDPLLDAIAFSRGRFLVWGGTGPTLVVPSWPEAARSIEDCRN